MLGYPDDLSARLADSEFRPIPVFRVGQGVVKIREEALPIIGMNRIAERLKVARPFLRCFGGRPEAGVVTPYLVARNIPFERHDIGRIKDHGQPPHAGLHDLLGLLPIGHVPQDLGKASQPTIGVVQRADDSQGPEPLPILAQVPTLVIGAATFPGRTQLGFGHPLLTVLRRKDERKVPPERLRLGVAQDVLGRDVPTGDPALGIEREDRVVLNVLHQGGETGLDLVTFPLGPPPLGHVLEGQQDPVVALLREPAGVEQHHLVPDVREIVRQLEIVDHRIVWEDLLEQGAQARNVPLPVAQVVEKPAFGVLRQNLKCAVEGAVGTLHPQMPVQDQQRFAHSVDDAADIQGVGARRRSRRCAVPRPVVHRHRTPSSRTGSTEVYPRGRSPGAVVSLRKNIATQAIASTAVSARIGSGVTLSRRRCRKSVRLPQALQAPTLPNLRRRSGKDVPG